LGEGVPWIFLLLGCVIGLPECGLGVGWHLVYRSDLWGTGSGSLSYFIFEDSRELVDLSDFSLPDARVALSRCTTEEAIRNRNTPRNVLLLGCASPDR